MMETKEEEENTEWEEEKVSPGKEEISFDRKCHSFLRNKRKTRNAGGIAEGEPVHDLKEHPRNSHNRNYRRPTAEIITTETENQLAESNAGESKYKNKRRKENEHRLVLNKEHRSSHHTENTEPYILVGGNIGTHPFRQGPRGYSPLGASRRRAKQGAQETTRREYCSQLLRSIRRLLSQAIPSRDRLQADSSAQVLQSTSPPQPGDPA